MTKHHNKRIREWEPFDEIRLKVVERYKTSGLSGDEWRFNIAIEFLFKGSVVLVKTARDMRTALMLLPSMWLKATEPIPDEVIKREERGCDQPGCVEPWVARFALRRQTASDGHYLASEDYLPAFRKFCKRHLRRGDCDREDCDSNYEPMDALTADDSTNKEESPSLLMGPDGELYEQVPTPKSKA